MRQTLTIAPAEIARQLALCDQIRALLDQRPGQKLAYVDTYGCQQNEADSERLRGYLARQNTGNGILGIRQKIKLRDS